ncbi:hypothetical protein GF391_03590 [Candidatus Uhrbacteria bacterium]|nr:hypothetical protein [Candidatus Uhrbacteria bacterium]
MAPKTYIPPHKQAQLKFSGKRGKQNRISSSHKKPPATPKRDRPSHPDETQQEAVCDLDPSFINPDGSINFWAAMSGPRLSESDSETDNPSEDK